MLRVILCLPGEATVFRVSIDQFDMSIVCWAHSIPYGSTSQFTINHYDLSLFGWRFFLKSIDISIVRSVSQSVVGWEYSRNSKNLYFQTYLINKTSTLTNKHFDQEMCHEIGAATLYIPWKSNHTSRWQGKKKSRQMRHVCDFEHFIYIYFFRKKKWQFTMYSLWQPTKCVLQLLATSVGHSWLECFEYQIGSRITYHGSVFSVYKCWL